MTPFDAYERSIAIKLHFEQDYYDFFKYAGKVKASGAAFKRRKDKFLYERICNTYNIEQWTDTLVYNAVYNGGRVLHISQLLEQEKIDIGTRWTNRKKDLEASIIRDIGIIRKRYANSFDSLFKTGVQSVHPPILRYYYQNLIGPDTLIVIDRIIMCFKLWNKVMKHDSMWKDTSFAFSKFSKFVEVESHAIENMILESFFAEKIT